MLVVFFFKQKTAYDMRISDWSSDVCSSDLSRWRGSSMGAGCVASRQGRKGDAKKEAGRQERGCKKGAAGTPPALSRLPRPRSPCRAGSATGRAPCREGVYMYV